MSIFNLGFSVLSHFSALRMYWCPNWSEVNVYGKWACRPRLRLWRAGRRVGRRRQVQSRTRPEGGSVCPQTHRAARWPLSASAASRLSLITRVEWTYLLVFCFPLIISSGMGGKWKQLFIGEIYELHLAARFPPLPCAAQGLGLLFASSGEEAGTFPSAETSF